jgi:diguanylate cyclase (GGDEF)-like protein/PAS domain S-box-containing protein
MAGWLRRHPEVLVFPLAMLALVSAGFSFALPPLALAGLVLATAGVVAWAYARWPEEQVGRSLHMRVGVQTAAMLVMLYATGWGPALALMFVFVVADNVRHSGSGAARTAVDWSLAAIALGQLGIQLGWVPDLLGVPAAHGIAVIGAITLLSVAQRIHLLTERKELAEEEAAEREQRFRSLVAHSSDVILVIGPDTVITYQSPSAAPVLGYPDDTLLGRRFGSLVHPSDLERVITSVQDMLASPGERTLVECRVRHADGHWVTVESNCQNLVHDPTIAGFVVNSRDVTDRKALEAQLHQRAFYDGLTGLSNRHLFRDRVDQAVARAQRRDEPFAVLFLDLDGFKNVNDTLGHPAGDALLRVVAERIGSAIRGHDTAARLGGDEFAVLVESMRDRSDAARVAERILAELREPISLDGTIVTIDASVGIAISDKESRQQEEYLRSDTDAIMRNADIAMYMAKNAGKGRYEIFEPAMHVEVVERLKLEADLQRAVEEGQFQLHYQPIVDLETQTPVGAEALIRWEHPERGIVSPAAFIPLAEETGLIIPIGRWVLREACRQTVAWNDEFVDRPALRISVNVAPRQLANGDLVTDVRAALDESGLDPELLTLEVTESALVNDVAQSVATMKQLKALGVKLAIDDFGTGYSSLAYLQNFPFDVLKIDRSFIDGLTRGTQSPAVVRAIVDIGRTLKLATVAEGIEHGEQLDRFRELHCTYGQGYLFARPQRAEEVAGVLARRGIISLPADEMTEVLAESEPR